MSGKLESLNEAELDVLKRFFAMLDDVVCTAGSNDLYLKDTPENRQLILEAEAYREGVTPDEWKLDENYSEPYVDDGKLFKNHKGDLIASDSEVFDYIRHKLGLEEE
jgi:hypothetical protein